MKNIFNSISFSYFKGLILRSKKTKLLLIYIRYLFHRYIKNCKYKNYYITNSLILENKSINNKLSSMFGYYNLSPENNHREYLICTIPIENKSESLTKKLQISIVNNRNYKDIEKTNSWNFQQGCMLQWYGNDKIIYNDYSTELNKYVSIIYNIENSTKKIIDYPIYSISNTGKFSISLNFDRLSLLRPEYGYLNKQCDFSSIQDDFIDGIWHVDLIENSSKLILSFDKLKSVYPCDTMHSAYHKVNHIDISPDEKRFMFLHRWIGPKGRFTRLITANIDGSDLFILNGDIMTSHCCWLNNNEIISYCYTENYKNAYVCFKDKSFTKRLISPKLPIEDGHPSVSPNKQWMIFDTYPKLDRMAQLYLYNFHNDNLYLIGEFYQPLKFSKDKRIDLHPKWNCFGDEIYFESGHTGKRNLYSIKIKNILI